jgi:hypothetical protein
MLVADSGENLDPTRLQAPTLWTRTCLLWPLSALVPDTGRKASPRARHILKTLCPPFPACQRHT